jgi:hypothetical protein
VWKEVNYFVFVISLYFVTSLPCKMTMCVAMQLNDSSLSSAELNVNAIHIQVVLHVNRDFNKTQSTEKFLFSYVVEKEIVEKGSSVTIMKASEL